MEFDKIKAELKSVDFDTTRTDKDDYFEAVVKTEALTSLTGALGKIFGPPAWPSSNKLSKEADKIIKNFGGIRKGQTLYLSCENSFIIFAMLWPWQDGERVTIKMAKV